MTGALGLSDGADGIRYGLGDYRLHVEMALDRLRELDAPARMAARDGSLWSRDPEVRAAVEDRLGWLDLPVTMSHEIPGVRALAAEVRSAGFRRVVVLGMGGSSLVAEVMAKALGAADGFPDLVVLDSTDPAEIRQATADCPVDRVLFVPASKTGGTIESRSLLAHFQHEVSSNPAWPSQFVAVTDPGTPFDRYATGQGIRAVYRNPPDMGGRYSALSLFGLVPGALVGADLKALLASAADVARRCGGARPVAENPGAALGAIMAALATADPRVDKLTLLCGPELAPLGPWIEQLLAESTGKEGVGILPVEGEPLREAAAYSRDRLFVYLRLSGVDSAALDALVHELARAGRLVVAIDLDSAADLGGQFYLWQYATAMAGALLNVDPFDQPNVELAKQRAATLLDEYARLGTLSRREPAASFGAVRLYGPALAAGSTSQYLHNYLSMARPGDYIALMAYVARNDGTYRRLQRLRAWAGRTSGCATTLGYGPRFLHSTGQYHKGGPATGVFIQITQDDAEDLAIPGQPYSFSVLKQAQAEGDLRALEDLERRVLRVHLGPDVLRALDALLVELDSGR